MDVQMIKEMAEAMRENGVTLLEATEGQLSVRMERAAQVVAAPAPAAQPAPAAEEPQAEPKPEQKDDGTEVKSPMVGVFYRGPAPDADPFIQVGSHVKKGETICILEAMKLLNEITADRAGTITDICVEDGQAVEFGQVLFHMSKE
ncbi:MAG: acetyl-CoA carboxylase biotin carboxyl carrier protein [Clostridiales bacterium]|jgi:acetyl-CoA carboxylase biotin carboxyl carrier protein|nr:acetyl-CoA carboxylase biotin carboxyl carrier protein [Clostridiales bacterium]